MTLPSSDQPKVAHRIEQKRLALDAMERPCIDCEVGEPHCCPLLTEETVVTY